MYIKRLEVFFISHKHSYPNLISLSIAPANVIIGKEYYDLTATIELMKYLKQRKIIDGFEFQLLEEWDEDSPPLAEENRYSSWLSSPKYSIESIAGFIKDSGANILSVHAKRDIGVYLCSNNPNKIETGRQLIDETLHFASRIGAGICVFHLWDTWKEDFNIQFLYETLKSISSNYPDIKASVENVPTHVKNCTPLELVRYFDWITLDLQWAALYNEFEKFADIRNKIVNIHLRGKPEKSKWVLNNTTFEFYEALRLIREDWGYTGILTMEPNELKAGQFDEFISAMQSLA